jgi:hypothetical protein
MRLGILTAVVSSFFVPSDAWAQPDVVESARGLCNQATEIWETQNQWAIRQLSTTYGEVYTEMSSSEFDDTIRTMYNTWSAAFGLEQPCDKDVPTVAASGSVTRTTWELFTRCLQSGIDARRAAVETFAREHQTLAQETLLGTINPTTSEASRSYLLSVAQSAGMRTCRL